MEHIIEMNEHTRKGNIMNIKADYYSYQFKQFNELTEQKSTKEKRYPE
jgi:hypothetical protein